MAENWLHKSKQPIRSQVSKLTQLLTMATTHKFPYQLIYGRKVITRFAFEGAVEKVLITPTCDWITTRDEESETFKSPHLDPDKIEMM